MKRHRKFIALILVVVLALVFLGGCGGGSSDAPKKEDEATEQKEDGNKATEQPEEKAPANEGAIEIGQPMKIGKYEVTVTGYTIVSEYEGNPALRIDYNFTNNSDDTIAPFIALSFKAFQEGVETDYAFGSDDVDLGIGQKDIQPGATIEGAQTVVGIASMDQPLELHIYESFSFNDKEKRIVTLNLAEIPQ